MTKLIDETEVIVQPHPNLNISRCVISCFDLIHMDEKDILEGLVEQREGVIFVKRITRMQDGKRVNTPALIFTFNKCTYPSHVKIGLLRTSTRPFYPNPLLCYGCFSYGHPRALVCSVALTALTNTKRKNVQKQSTAETAMEITDRIVANVRYIKRKWISSG